MISKPSAALVDETFVGQVEQEITTLQQVMGYALPQTEQTALRERPPPLTDRDLG